MCFIFSFSYDEKSLSQAKCFILKTPLLSIYEVSQNEVWSNFKFLERWTLLQFRMIASKIKSGSKFILNTRSGNNPKICHPSQVDQSSSDMHIKHWIKVHTPGYNISNCSMVSQWWNLLKIQPWIWKHSLNQISFKLKLATSAK